MTREEAIAALDDGKTLTHKYFTSSEWVRGAGCMYEFEDGVMCSPSEFWAYRRDDGFNDGWSELV